MKTVTKLRVLFTLVGLIFSTCISGQAQVEILQSDFLGMIGSTQVMLLEERSGVTINVGQAGANQVWDFRNQSIVDTLFSRHVFSAPDEIEGGENFPEANLAEIITLLPEQGISNTNFYQITPGYFIERGNISRFTTPVDTSLVSFASDTTGPLPLAFGNSWVSTRNDTDNAFGIITVDIDTIVNTIDGWGTVRLPLGDFECLRLRQDKKIINETITPVPSSSTETFIQYNWIARGIFNVAWAQSQDGNTNPNFTTARGFGRLDSLSQGPATGVANSRLPEIFSLSQNYPNPFNPETAINYNLEQSGQVAVAVYNIQGQLVKTLVSGHQPAGAYRVTWDATDETGGKVSSGLYVYRLKVGNFSRSMKMLLLQ